MSSIDNVNDLAPRVQYVASASQTVFDYPFPIFADGDLVVDVDGDDNLPFTVSGAGNDAGGSVTLDAALAGGEIVTIYRDTAIARTTDFPQSGQWKSASTNDQFDKLTVICQELAAKIKRCIRWPFTATQTDAGLELSPIENWYDKVLYISSTGILQAASIVSSVVVLTADLIGSLIYPTSGAETSAGITPTNRWYGYDNLLRYGLVPNSAPAATANTIALKALWNPSVTGPVGKFNFPNTTGTDVYYLNGVIPIRDGVHIDLNGCTINYTATGSSADTNSGLFFALRDFSCENGSFAVAFATGVATSAGNAIQIGARGSDSSYFTVYDSLLSAPMGNIKLRNLKIVSNNTGANLASCGAIAITGGVHGIEMENIFIDGSGTLTQGVTYEFGFATSGTQSARQTSHARNWNIRNLEVQNLDPVNGIALVAAGPYNLSVDGMLATSVGSVVSVTPGESLNYRPWAGVDAVGAKRNITLRNIVGQNLGNTGITFAGAQLASGGYLDTVVTALGHPADYQAQTDLYDCLLENFALSGNSNGWGVLTSAGKVRIANGYISGGFERGIVGTDECTHLDIDLVNVHECTQTGIDLAIGSAIWGTARKKVGNIRNCFIAGNGTSAANTYPGILIGNSASVLIEGNRLNYETAHDVADETTQGNAVQLAAGAQGVVCRGNRVGKIIAGSFAYYSTLAGGVLNGNNIVGPMGDSSNSGPWNIESAAQAASTTLGAKTSNVNTFGKYFGRLAYNTSTAVLFVAQGSTDVSAWVSVDGVTTITPT